MEKKRLTLLRHAKSSWSDDTLPDVDRPLSQRGEQDAPEMASRLAARHTHPSRILSSHARRAVRTATIIARALDVPDSRLRLESALYLATPDEILGVITGQDDSIAELMVVGHNPGLTELANRLLPDLALDNLPTTGVITAELGAKGWSELETAPCRLAYYDYPKNARK